MGVFTATKRLAAAVELINQVDAKILLKILGRILPAMQSKKAGANLFEPAELKQMETMLSLTPTQLSLFLEACMFIFDKTGYHKLRQDKLSAELAELQVAKPQVAAFVKAWEMGGGALVQKLAAHTLGGPAVLKSVDWQVNLQVAERDKGTQQDARALLQLGIASSTAEGAPVEELATEFSHDQLFELFKSIERAQQQLDRLGV